MYYAHTETIATINLKYKVKNHNALRLISQEFRDVSVHLMAHLKGIYSSMTCKSRNLKMCMSGHLSKGLHRCHKN